MLGIWGPEGTRVVASESAWKEPIKWNAEAARDGVRRRVFCASMADVFEDWQGPMAAANGNQLWWCYGSLSNSPIPSVGLEAGCRLATMSDCRKRLFYLIEDTPHLDWQLLTKRPENVLRMVPKEWLGRWPANVWIGTSVENQEAADKRIPHLLQVPAAVRFLSCEPLLGPVDLAADGLWYLDCPRCEEEGMHCPDTGAWECSACDGTQKSNEVGISWVIVGGESGPKARPFHLEWAQSIQIQCHKAWVPFFFKQAGSNAWDWDRGEPENYIQPELVKLSLRDSKGGDLGELPIGLSECEFPVTQGTP